jgi:TatD DNase family protein
LASRRVYTRRLASLEPPNAGKAEEREVIVLIDSHAHLTDDRLLPDVENVVKRALDNGVTSIVTVGTNAADSGDAVELASHLPGVFASVGVHPHAADSASDEAFAMIAELASRPRVVAIGETGLDYHYDNSPREAQRVAFERHLELARTLQLPVVVHSRSADEDTAAMLRNAGEGVTGVLHCFAGGRALLETALECGWYVSFAGLITFSKYADADLVRIVPHDRILVETDSPYLAPVPHRGKQNEPAYVTLVAARAAQMRDEDPAGFAAATLRNARRFYGLEEKGA